MRLIRNERENERNNRVLDEAEYIIEYEATVRKVGSVKKVSKSTVHKDMVERLQDIDSEKYEKVRSILDKNKAERHMRGGLATRQKYLTSQVTHEKLKNS